MPQKLIIFGLAGALVIALMVIAFLLGQRSAGPTLVVGTAIQGGAAPPPPVPSEIVDDPAASDEPPSPPRPARRPAPVPTFADPPPDDVVVVERNGRPSLVTPKTAPGDEETDRPVEAPTDPALAQYLDAVTQLGAVGSDPQSSAQQLLGQSMGGDLSGLDSLLRQLDDAERKAQALHPPPRAGRHHQLLLSTLADSRRLLTAARDGLAKQDPDALTSLLPKAQALERGAKALAAEEAELRAQVAPR